MNLKTIGINGILILAASFLNSYGMDYTKAPRSSIAEYQEACEEAIRTNNMDWFIRLITDKPSLNRYVGDCFPTLLLLISQERYDMADMLIEKGVDLRDKAPDGRGVFHFAANVGNRCFLKKLLRLYPSGVGQRDEAGNIPLVYAAMREANPLLKSLIKACLDDDEKNPKKVSLINTRNYDKKTPLFYAYLYKNVQNIKLLRKYGAKK